MKEETNETSLAVVNESIFTKIRKFLISKFSKKDVIIMEDEENMIRNSKDKEELKIKDQELEEKDVSKKESAEEIFEEKEEIERKLMNYDNSIKNAFN